MRSTRLRARLVVLLTALAMLLCACGGLPDHGEVHRQVPAKSAGPRQDVPYFDPPRPAPGASKEQIVQGFVVAMQAIPINPAAARSYLSERARSTWQPSGGIIVFDGYAPPRDTANGDVALRLTDAHRLDSRGGWSPRPTHNETVHLRLVKEDGQWRIDNPPNAMMVRTDTFHSQYQPFDLYFFDRTGQVLVPDPVYIVKGEQTATNLVNGLLRGPDPRLAPVVRSAFPSQTSLDVSVVVTNSGIADVPLSNQVLKLTPDELGRAMIQIAQTLRAVPGINRVRLTVGGSTVPMPDGRTTIDVDEGSEFEPTGPGASHELLGIRKGRVVSIAGTTARPIAGELGKPGFALRSLSLERSGGELAAVSEDGTSVFVSPTEPTVPVRKIFSGGEDLLQPSYDIYGRLWLVDRTASGAVVHVLYKGRDRTVRVPGLSGEDITAFAVSPDGSRLVAALGSRAAPVLSVSSILRGPGGRVLRGLQPRRVPVADYSVDSDLGPVVDVAWRSGTEIAVLTHPRTGLSRVLTVMSDGSPGGPDLAPPDAFNGDARALVVSDDSQLPMMLVDSTGRLETVDAAGKWTPTGVDHVIGAAYAN